MADEQTLTLVAVADVDVSAADENAEAHFDLVRPILAAGDITFGQLEFPLANSGGRQIGVGDSTAVMADEEKDPRKSARILAGAGFDVMSCASNHIMDFSAQGLLDTIDAVTEETGIKLVGAGRTAQDARKPAIIERDGTKVGFLAYCSVLLKDHWAGTEKRRGGVVVDRPGVNPLRAHSYYEQVDWQPGTMPRIVTQVYAEDLAAMVHDIRQLREQVDVVVVSAHWGVHHEPGTIAMYQIEAAHAAIDAGADLILGHHPHIIKGIEFYRGKPIFYALNNFVFRVRNTEGVYIDPGHGETYDAQKTFIAKITIRGGQISRVAIVPCFLDAASTPQPLPRSDPRSEEIRRYLEWVCEHNTPFSKALKRAFPPFPTTFTFDADEIVCTA